MLAVIGIAVGASVTGAGTTSGSNHAAAAATSSAPTSQAPTSAAPKPAPKTTTVAPKPKPKPPPPKPKPKPPPPKPKPTFATFGDGQHIVGTDIKPGTYRTTGADGCYWERDKDFTGSDNSILANDNPSGGSVVTILPTDKGFDSEDCGTWTTDLSQQSNSMTSVGDGTWIVGTDLEPGTYRTTGGSECYYETTNDFTHGDNSILANDLPSGAAVVTIGPSVKGFTSNGCGTWTKIG